MTLPADLHTLPTLGVGLSLSFELPPDPVALARHPGGPTFIEYAGIVDPASIATRIQQLRGLQVPVLYHPSCLNLCGPWKNPPNWLDAVNRHVQAVGSAWLAQDVSVCFATEEPGYSVQLGWFVPPILTRASLEEAVERVLEVRAQVSAPLLLEPPPVTWHLGEMHMLPWIQALAERTGCGLLLDCGHLCSHQKVEGWSLAQGLSEIDLDRVIELHVAGGVIRRVEDREYYIDAHDLPILPETFEIFSALLQGCAHLRAVCLECEGAAAEMVLPALHRVRNLTRQHTSSARLRQVLA